MATKDDILIRPFEEPDVPQLLRLMRGLAVFEGYIDKFRVTETDLVRHGLADNPRFEAFVGQGTEGGPLLGMAVIYRIPWTYDMRPTVILKELFVTDAARGRGVGAALMRRVAKRAADLDCPRLQWTVLQTNDPAVDFYRKLGAVQDEVWDTWGFDESAIAKLAAPDPRR